MNTNGIWKVLLGPVLLLVLSYIIDFVRYPMWQFFSNLESIFVVMFLSYFIIFTVALLLLKKDSKKNLRDVFKNKSDRMIFYGLLFGLLYLGLYYLISYGLGSNFEFGSFPNLRGYEGYTVFSIGSVFLLYLLFSVFGGFAEEVAYRGYIQTRVSDRCGSLLGIIASTIFFSLQHIHVFQAGWIFQFIQGQLLHVALFGIFASYLFYKSAENIWSVVSFHVLLNAFSVSVPIIVSDAYPFTFYVAEIISFTVLILILKYLPLKNK